MGEVGVCFIAAEGYSNYPAIQYLPASAFLPTAVFPFPPPRGGVPRDDMKNGFVASSCVDINPISIVPIAESTPDSTIASSTSPGVFQMASISSPPVVTPIVTFESSNETVYDRGERRVFQSPIGKWKGFVERGGLEAIIANKNISESRLRDFPFHVRKFRTEIYWKAFQAPLFYRLCEHERGNIVIKRLIEEAGKVELGWAFELLRGKICELSLGRFSWRVVQKALQCLDARSVAVLATELVGCESLLATHPSGSLVLQTVLQCFQVSEFRFIITGLTSSQEVLRVVTKDKYGCRVIECALKVLAWCREHGSQLAKSLFSVLGDAVMENGEEYINDEQGNFVMQLLLSSSLYAPYQQQIIQRFVLRNVLALSQEKHGSHVVEKAFQHAPPPLLTSLMHEVFYGYEPDEEGRDALEVMLFDMYGNYVVQTMIETATAVREGAREGDRCWFTLLVSRVISRQTRLSFLSSGKNIINNLHMIMKKRLTPLCSSSSEQISVVSSSQGEVAQTKTIPAKFR